VGHRLTGTLSKESQMGQLCFISNSVSLPGVPFGSYVLLQRVGAGGMAELFRAGKMGDAPGPAAYCIKKILPRYAANDSFRKLFANEVRIASVLHHPNIVRVFEHGEVYGELFLSMELVRGISLSRLLQRMQLMELGPMPVPVCVFIAKEMLRGLAHAHGLSDDKGRKLDIVHGDVSPHNVMISFEGQVKLTDFGLAKMRSFGLPSRSASAVPPKAAYSPLEVWQGKSADQRADVFAVAVTLYQLLTGRVPFPGDDASVALRMAHGEYIAPSQLNSEVSPLLEQHLAMALAGNRLERTASAEAFLGALESSTKPDGAPMQLLRELLSKAFTDERQRSLEEKKEVIDLGPPAAAKQVPSSVDVQTKSNTYRILALLLVLLSAFAALVGTRCR
jgi:eukaryotic-like serine/threonine-protein kinase